MQTKTVASPAGNITGVVTDYGALFRGVPYAEAERFGKPRPVPARDIDATAPGPCCYQMRAFWNEEHRFYYREFRQGQTFRYGEDCQVLDIYAPEGAKDAPVIVFIHGGSFTGGSADEKQFDGSAYARRGVVYVAINYRLNIFGFFADGEHSAGSLGLLDQAAAINWVRANISAFGGDPDRITLMGQSAGAMSVQTLICTDAFRDIIHGAVMLSGGGKRGAMLPVTKPSTRYWNSLVKASGARTFEEFKEMPAEEIWTVWKKTHLVGKVLQTKPVIDGELVTSSAYDTRVPVVIGTVKKDLLTPVLKHMARAFARAQAKKGAKAYVYELDRLLPPDQSSFHSCDLWYMLGSLGNSSRPFTDSDRALSDELADRIAAFAADGDPNTGRYGGWKPFGGKRDIMRFV